MAYFFTKDGINYNGSAISKPGVFRIYRIRMGFRTQRELYVGESINMKEALLELCTGGSAESACLQTWGADYWECQVVENHEKRKEQARRWKMKYAPFCNVEGAPIPRSWTS